VEYVVTRPSLLLLLFVLQCLMHLEDQLQSIYLKSKLLAEYIKVHHRVFSHELASLHEYVNSVFQRQLSFYV